MQRPYDRREFLKLASFGGAVFASGLGLAGCAEGTATSKADTEEFYFVQLSDTHWGFEGPPNPDAKVTLKKAVATVNALSEPPNFIVFTGDLTHTTDDPKVRRQRMAEFRDKVGKRPVYLCFDMDVFDPSCAPGVCTPSWGGLSAREGIDLLRCLTDLNIVAVDVNTVSPPQDVNGMAAHLCAHVIYESLVLLSRQMGLAGRR